MKRKNKSTRRTDAVQPLPLPADAGEIAFAHGVSRRVVVVDAAESPLFEQIIYIVRDDAAGARATAAAKNLYRPADLAVLCRRCAGRRHRILPVLRLVSGRISNDPEGCVSSGSFSAEKPVVNA